MIRTLQRRQRRPLVLDRKSRIRKRNGQSIFPPAVPIQQYLHPHRSLSSLSHNNHKQQYSSTPPRHHSSAAAAMLNDDDHHDHEHQHHHPEEEDLFVRSSLSQFLIPELRHTAHLLPMEEYQQPLESAPPPDDDGTSPNMTLDARMAAWDESPWKGVFGDGDSEVRELEDPELFREIDEQHQNRSFVEMLETIPKGKKDDKSELNKSFIELLQSFDPQNPPKLEDYATREEALEHIQLWLECEAQQEAVLRYQNILESARERKDYGSLPVVQNLIAHWIPALTVEYEKLQTEFLCKPHDGKTMTSLKKFGPYICVVPARKLAVIALHESIMATVSLDGIEYGLSVPALMKRIGNAVEQEVLIHRLLRQRFLAAQQDRKEQKATEALAAEGDPSAALAEVDLLAKFYREKLLTSGGGKDFPNTESEPVQSKTGDTKASVMRTGVTRNLHRWSYASSHLKSLLDEISVHNPAAAQRQRNIALAVKKARQAEDTNDPWEVTGIVQLGAALFKTILDKCIVPTKFGGNGKEDKLFQVHKMWMKKKLKFKSYIVLNDDIYKMIVDDQMQSLAAVSTRHKPMVVPPKPWKSESDGGYRVLQVEIMRYSCPMQKRTLQQAEMTAVIDGLNSLGRVKWRVNGAVLDIAQQCWDDKMAVGTDIPSRLDVKVPPEPTIPEREKLEKGTPEYEAKAKVYQDYREKMTKFARMRQKNMVRGFKTSAIGITHFFLQDLRSLRCTALLKLRQAEKFRSFDEIYFPYNIDFRGRAYPIPPHLSNVGSDMCRGILMFSEAKPLGTRGLYWLKVHLANFAGMDKVAFDERAQFVDNNIDKVLDSAANPFGGERWWLSLEDPFQGLATCFEIAKALDSGDPESYECALPVHMDGSCNGLQHYAALGRDSVGGKAVNLCQTDEPQDVYIGVMHEVVRRVAIEAAKKLPFAADDPATLSSAQKSQLKKNNAAKLVDGLVDRAVVKRTVMTSVYGVTFIGARTQIQEKIEQKLSARGYDVDEHNREVFHGCSYLAFITMEVIGDLFTGAKGTMNWLTACARLISQQGHPVAWMTPLGLPAIQPYRQEKVATLVTLLQTISLAHSSPDLPLHKKRQTSAFPPNYIHSLDSCHMLLTALEMDRRGLTFSAVHDSFWTHACDVDEMNATLRSEFVDLYSQPLLERLKETWELRYPDIMFPELPQRGDLDIDGVRNAEFFFQ